MRLPDNEEQWMDEVYLAEEAYLAGDRTRLGGFRLARNLRAARAAQADGGGKRVRQASKPVAGINKPAGR